MQKPKFVTPRFIENGVRYAVFFLAVTLTPFLALPIAPLFDWAGYSLMRPLFVEVFTCIFWGFEAIGFRYLSRYLKRKLGTEEKAETEEMLDSNENENALGMSELNKKVKKGARPPLPLKNVGILTGICVVCVLIISAIIGFQVKPFYDIGEKVTGYEIFNALGVIGRNAFKCLWIVAMLHAATAMAEEVVATLKTDKQKRWQVWLLTTGIILVFGILDIFTSVVTYPMKLRQVLLAVAYLGCYVAFSAIYHYTERNYAKSFFLVLLVYWF